MKQFVLMTFILMNLSAKLSASPAEGGYQFLPSNGYASNQMHCETNETCTTFCKTLNPGVSVIGTCSEDKSSCSCAKDGSRVRVRLIEEKPPVQKPAEHREGEWVPQMLNCTGSEYSLVICKAFCTSLSYGGGYCNTKQLTCVCSGVHPAVVQEAPIPAIFNFYLEKLPPIEKTTTKPKPSMLQEWTPITTNANTGNKFVGQNPYNTNNQLFHYTNSKQQPSVSNTNTLQQSSSPSEFNQHPQQQGLYTLPSNYWQWQQQYPQEYFQQHFSNPVQTISPSVSSSSSGNNTNANLTIANSQSDASRTPILSTDAAISSSENPSSPRRKRSSGSFNAFL